jgi:monolysocardiolipin acyltransferase
MHSIYGGLYQPTITQCIRLLSTVPFTTPIPPPSAVEHGTAPSPPSDPFSSSLLTYSTTGTDAYPSPSAYDSRRHAWVHIFPEGRVHQHPEHRMRYFKWGIARLILESEPCPDVVPIFLEGTKDVMPEDRGWPRPVPRVGKRVEITFGERVKREVLSQFRERWRRIREKVGGDESVLMEAEEAIGLRIEVAKFIRGEIEALRQKRGYSEDDPKSGFVETWMEEGETKSSGRKKDDSLLGDT